MVQCPRREFVTDVDSPIADAHTEEILAREIREKKLIFGKILPVLAHLNNSRRFASNQFSDAIVDDVGNLELDGARCKR